MKAIKFPYALAALSVIAAISSAPAHALSVSYYLDQSNIDAAPYMDGQNFLQVTISDNVNGNIDFTVQTLAPLSINAGSNYGIQSFGFNTMLSLSAANIIEPAGWGVSSNRNQDGFGNFINIVSGTGSNRADPLAFSITGISGDTPMDYVMFSSGGTQGDVYFAAHVAGLSTNVTSGYFGGSTLAPVPEPETYAMLLAGLGLVGFAARRKLNR